MVLVSPSTLPGRYAGTMSSDAAREIVDLDLTLLDSSMEAEGRMSDAHDGGMVEFSVKELLVDIRHAVDEVGATTRAEVASSERRLTDRINVVETTTKERAEAQEKRIAEMDGRIMEVRLFNARVAGAVALAMFLGAGIGAAIFALLQ